jgi:GTP-binding protein
VPKSVKEDWQAFLWDYLTTRSTLVGLVAMIDARRGVMDADEALLRGFLPSGRPVLILATKVDKLTPTAKRAALASIRADVDRLFAPFAGQVEVVGFSALRREGLEAANRAIARMLAPEG